MEKLTNLVECSGNLSNFCVRLFEAHLTWNSRIATSPWKSHEKNMKQPYGPYRFMAIEAIPFSLAPTKNWNGPGPRQWPYGTDIPSHPAVFGMCTNKGPWRSSLAPNLTSFHRENDGKMVGKSWENDGKIMGKWSENGTKIVDRWTWTWW